MKKATLLVFLFLLTACQFRPTPEVVEVTVPVEVTVLVTQPPLPTHTAYPTHTPYPTYTPYPTCAPCPPSSPPTNTPARSPGTTPSPALPPPTIPVTQTSVVPVTVAPESVVLPDCPNPRARLTYPTVNAVLKGVVEIRGSAYIDNFDYYKFEFLSKGATEWSFVQRFENTVVDGVLGIWDTSALPAGAYKFRLVVVDKTGNYPKPCEVEVIVEH